MARKTDPVLVRMPPGLHASLIALADREQRSLNAQIVFMLGEAAVTHGISAAEVARLLHGE